MVYSQTRPWPCKNAPCLWLYREACRYLEKYRSSRHPASQTSLVTATSLISLNEPLLQIVNWTSLPNSATTVISQQSAQTHALLSTTLPYREPCGRMSMMMMIMRRGMSTSTCQITDSSTCQTTDLVVAETQVFKYGPGLEPL